MARIACAVILTFGSAALALFAGRAPQTVTVTGTVVVARSTAVPGKLEGGNAVVWLKPPGSANRISTPRPHFKMLQNHKRFDPHVLAVPVGSVIDFPNLDPFLHNVFSMFEGKRFDLGLYEAGGATHSVIFDSPGVHYIFCNIHPEMSAAVVVIDSPYYATSNRAGQFSIANVAPGNYLLYVWHERGKASDYPRAITISPETASLGTIQLVDAGELLANHKNKYGHDYDPPPASPVYK